MRLPAQWRVRGAARPRQGKIVKPSALPAWPRSDGVGNAVLNARADEAEVARMVLRLGAEEGTTLRALRAHVHDLGATTPSGRGAHLQRTTLQHRLGQAAAVRTFHGLVTQAVPPANPRQQSGRWSRQRGGITCRKGRGPGAGDRA